MDKEFKIGSTVLIRNENKVSKMSKEFKETGKIIEELGKNKYRVGRKDGRGLIRHWIQLKLAKGM